MDEKGLKDLLKLTLKLSDQELKDWSDNPAERLDPERQKWLRETIDQLLKNSDTQILKHCLDCLTSTGAEETNEENLESKSKALDEIHNLLDLDSNATDLNLMGGIYIVTSYLKSQYSSLRWRAAEIIADVTQNKPVCQEVVVKANTIPRLVEILKTDEVDLVKVKALYALSCATRHFSPALTVFLQSDGVAALLESLKSNFEKLRTKAAFMLINLINEDETVVSRYPLSEIIPLLISILKGKHSSSHEHITCLLSVLVAKNKEAILLCRSPEYGLKKLLSDKQAELSKVDKEAHQEEIMYCNEVLKICFSS
eukprot:gene8252-9134_t